MTVAVQNALKGFPYLVTPPTSGSLVYLFFKLLPFSYNASAYKAQNKNWCVIGYVKVQNCLFTDFLAILGQILLCW